MAKQRGLKANDAERMFHKWLIGQSFERGSIARAVRTRWQREDILACDLIACDGKGFNFYQLTTQKGRVARRRKIEKVAWPYGPGYVVYLVTHERVPDPANRNKSMSYWKFEAYHPKAGWTEPFAIQFNEKETEAIRLKEKDISDSEKVSTPKTKKDISDAMKRSTPKIGKGAKK